MKKRIAAINPSRRVQIPDHGARVFRALVSSSLGRVAIDWYDGTAGPRVHRILLPSEQDNRSCGAPSGGPERGSCPPIDDLAGKIRAQCEGHAAAFDIAMLDLDRCYPFQRKVLRAEFGIPRGRVSTYGRIAARIGHPGAARAVGSALARNPYPLVIPCHRAIRENGTLGGFRGGLSMKRVLLELEGIEFSGWGRVMTDRFYY